jgi:ABC-type sugar transport system ATPase subunit
MSLLELERVTKSFGRGATRRTVLREVSLKIEPGELVAVWGARRSGRSTLLRLAAGIAQPDEGMVRIDGHDLGGREGERRRQVVGYCITTRQPRDGQLVLELLMTDQLVQGGVSIAHSDQRAHAELARVGAEGCAARPLKELDTAEAVRVAIARALLRKPRLLVIDEPTLGVDLLVRDKILLLLRALADEGIAVLMTAGETPCLSGADRALSLDQGQLHGDTEPKMPPDEDESQAAPVIPLRRSA